MKMGARNVVSMGRNCENNLLDSWRIHQGSTFILRESPTTAQASARQQQRVLEEKSSSTNSAGTAGSKRAD